MKRDRTLTGGISRFLLPLCLIAVAPSLFAGGEGESRVEPAEPARSDESAARIEFLVGEVTVDGDEALIGMSLDPGSTVRTGSDGTVDIVFGSGNALRVSEDTVMVMDLSDPAVGLDIRRGTVSAVFEGLESIGTGPDDTFIVRTPSTVAGVRGTVFFVKIEDPDTTYVCTCHGIIDFDQSGLTVSAARHEATRFVRSDGEVTALRAPGIYHDSDDLNEIAAIVGIEIAWGEEP